MSPQLSIYALLLIWLLATAFGFKPDAGAKAQSPGLPSAGVTEPGHRIFTSPFYP
jgi:hypothetical protein